MADLNLAAAADLVLLQHQLGEPAALKLWMTLTGLSTLEALDYAQSLATPPDDEHDHDGRPMIGGSGTLSEFRILPEGAFVRRDGPA